MVIRRIRFILWGYYITIGIGMEIYINKWGKEYCGIGSE
jgi:hypothetical protein